jgi:putative addiction module component (TIGR02574 family)
MRNTDFDFSKLSIAERIQLAEDLWDSIPAEGADVPLTEAQKAELDRRLEELEHDPDAGEPWEVVRARLFDRLKRGE